MKDDCMSFKAITQDKDVHEVSRMFSACLQLVSLVSSQCYTRKLHQKNGILHKSVLLHEFSIFSSIFVNGGTTPTTEENGQKFRNLME